MGKILCRIPSGLGNATITRLFVAINAARFDQNVLTEAMLVVMDC